MISSLLSDPGMSAPRPPNMPGWTDPVRFGRRSVAAAGHVSLQSHERTLASHQQTKQVVSLGNQNYSNATPSWNLLLSQDTRICLYRLETTPVMSCTVLEDVFFVLLNQEIVEVCFRRLCGLLALASAQDDCGKWSLLFVQRC